MVIIDAMQMTGNPCCARIRICCAVSKAENLFKKAKINAISGNIAATANGGTAVGGFPMFKSKEKGKIYLKRPYNYG